MNRRTRLSLWHPSARKFRTRVIRYLEARVEALANVGEVGDMKRDVALENQRRATNDILYRIRGMR